MKRINWGACDLRYGPDASPYTYIRNFLFVAVGLFLSLGANAQTPDDAILMNNREACILLNYSSGQFDQYWEGSKLRFNETIATVNRSVVMPMAAVGVLPRLNLYVAAPFVQTGSSQPNGGHLIGVKGFQDLGLAAKYAFVDKEMAGNRLAVLGTLGFSTPMTNYLSDYMPYSLGFGAPEWSYRGIVQYQMKSGAYARVSGAYLWRGYTEAERDFYYNNGAYYTSWMDVPSAFQLNGVLGAWLFKSALRVEANLSRMQSTSGDDIRAYNAPQPTNKTEMTQAGLLAQYYPKKFLKGFGVVATHSRVLAGRNTGKMNATSLGITYQFYYVKPKNQP